VLRFPSERLLREKSVETKNQVSGALTNLGTIDKFLKHQLRTNPGDRDLRVAAVLTGVELAARPFITASEDSEFFRVGEIFPEDAGFI
jgi:hypothetical protein